MGLNLTTFLTLQEGCYKLRRQYGQISLTIAQIKRDSQLAPART